MTQPNFKDKLYNSYLSTGQSADDVNTKNLFSKRKISHQHNINKHFPKNKNATILDLGCGHGSFIYFIKQAGYKNVIGIDVSKEEVDLAHQLGISEIKQIDINEYLSSTTNRYDVVLLMDVLEHIESNKVLDLLEKINTILTPDGIMILHVPNGEGLFGMRIKYGDFTHENAFTLKSLKQILTATGYYEIKGYEEKPIVHNSISFMRRIIWQLFTIKYRLLLMAETGLKKFILSQNILVVAKKK